jgi:hypothetical protein
MKQNIIPSILFLVLLAACQPVSAGTILQEVLQGIESCHSQSGVQQQDEAASFTCNSSADASYTISMIRFSDKAAAKEQFKNNRGSTPVECFHGYDQTLILSSGTGNAYITGEQLEWQAGSWLVTVQASYDYRYFHFNSQDFSEAVYAAAIKHDLFPDGTCP